MASLRVVMLYQSCSFFIYIYDFVRFSSPVNFAIYADDTTLSFETENLCKSATPKQCRGKQSIIMGLQRPPNSKNPKNKLYDLPKDKCKPPRHVVLTYHWRKRISQGLQS